MQPRLLVARQLLAEKRYGCWPPATHAHGWIAPRLLVGRLAGYGLAGRRPLARDLLQALLCLVPDGRGEALALLIALASRDGGLRRLATDLLIEGIAGGCAHPGELAGVLRRLAASGWLKANRLSETLGEVARVSPLHQWAVAGIIEGALDVSLAQTGKSNVALELLHEWLADMNCGPSAETAQRPSAITSGKAGIAPGAIRARRSPSPGVFGRSATSSVGSTPAPGRSLGGGSAPEPGGHLSYALPE
jgi:hypothetical protein